MYSPLQLSALGLGSELRLQTLMLGSLSLGTAAPGFQSLGPNSSAPHCCRVPAQALPLSPCFPRTTGCCSWRRARRATASVPCCVSCYCCATIPFSPLCLVGAIMGGPGAPGLPVPNSMGLWIMAELGLVSWGFPAHHPLPCSVTVFQSQLASMC